MIPPRKKVLQHFKVVVINTAMYFTNTSPVHSYNQKTFSSYELRDIIPLLTQRKTIKNVGCYETTWGFIIDSPAKSKTEKTEFTVAGILRDAE